GLDLSSGSTVILRAVTSKPGQAPSQASMKIADTIMTNRLNGSGISGAQVRQQGSNIIAVSVPGKESQEVVRLVGTTAQMRFRQVLLVAPGFPEQVTTPAPGASPSASASRSASASASPGATAPASPSPSTSPKATASPKSTSGSNGAGQAAGARSLAGSGSARQATQPKAKRSASPKATSSASATATPTPTPSGTPSVQTILPTTANAQGNASLVSKAVQKQFNELNCKQNWQQKIYHGDSTLWDNPHTQIVACDASGNKFALDVAKVTGQQLTSAGAALNSTNGQWVVNLNLNGTAARNFATLTASMYSKYFSTATNQQTSVLDQFAIVLDGKVITAPDIVQPITGGQAQISGGQPPFSQSSATQLANQLKYGSLPLTFRIASVASVSPQLGSAQLTAGLTAAAVGLLLVVIYSFLYYRGLGLVSVSSLAVAALLSYLAVILLSKYEGLTLSLAGIAGLIVAIGITADSFVVYFERLRDEVREGKSLRAAVERGWQRARRTILVSDTVSFLAAALLYIFAIGDVRGFAFTLGLTTLVDVVVVFLFTKPMITLLARTKFYGQGHRLSGLDPARLGARSPWRGARRPPAARPAAGGAASSTTSAAKARTSAKEA
ncbi:MAG TPA: protein translocase subunit SecD, partial [Streptosporangiaceae bacterium]